MTGHGAERELAFIGDVHLAPGDVHLAPFLDLLDRLGACAARLVLIGDLFDVWIGGHAPAPPHQAAVLSRLAELRRRGLVVRYLEGNRDYRVGVGPGGSAFDEVAAGVTERFGGHRLWATHGDLANPADRQYRLWRRASRSAPLWWLWNRLPRGRRLALAARLEQRMRRSNPAFKGEFPEAVVREYARGFLRAGHDVVVLGHFHVERDLVASDPPGRIVVLPEWKGSRRHLRVGPDGAIGFVDSL
jgi:UDP-2,3-diacylglucosamine hydrolase